LFVFVSSLVLFTFFVLVTCAMIKPTTLRFSVHVKLSQSTIRYGKSLYIVSYHRIVDCMSVYKINRRFARLLSLALLAPLTLLVDSSKVGHYDGHRKSND